MSLLDGNWLNGRQEMKVFDSYSSSKTIWIVLLIFAVCGDASPLQKFPMIIYTRLIVENTNDRRILFNTYNIHRIINRLRKKTKPKYLCCLQARNEDDCLYLCWNLNGAMINRCSTQITMFSASRRDQKST